MGSVRGSHKQLGPHPILNLPQPKQLKLEIKRSASKDGNQTDTMLLHKDSAKLTELSSKDLVKYEEHSTGKSWDGQGGRFRKLGTGVK